MTRRCWISLLALGCASSPPPTVRVGPADVVVDVTPSEDCAPESLPGWVAVDAAWLESGDTLLVRARHCGEARVRACGAMAPEAIDPGWFNVTVGVSEDCPDRVERVLRVDLSASRVARRPGLDRVDQRAVRPSATVGMGPQVIPIWVRGD